MTALDDRPALALPTGAVEVLPADVERGPWLAERRKSIGGSDASTLVDLNPYGSRYQLYLDKRGDLPDRPATSAMEWGNLLEPVLRDWTARTYQLDVHRVGMLRRPDHPRLHANPDGIVFEHGRPVAGAEFKTSSSRFAWQWADGQAPDHAELQAQLCMFVTGLRSWWVVGLLDGRDPQVRLVHASPEIGQRIADRAAAFYRDHVEPGIPPDVDGSNATATAIRAALARPVDGRAIALTPALAELFRARAVANAAVDAAEKAANEADARLRLALGDAVVVVDDPTRRADLKPNEGGRIVYATADCNGKFAPARLAADHPEVVEEFTHDMPVLDVTALKTQRPEMYRAYCARQIRPRKTLAEKLAELDASPIPGRTS